MLKILKHFSVVYGRPIKRIWKPKNLDLLDTHATIGMYLHGFEKLNLPDIDKQAETWAIG